MKGLPQSKSMAPAVQAQWAETLTWGQDKGHPGGQGLLQGQELGSWSMPCCGAFTYSELAW